MKPIDGIKEENEPKLISKVYCNMYSAAAASTEKKFKVDVYVGVG